MRLKTKVAALCATGAFFVSGCSSAEQASEYDPVQIGEKYDRIWVDTEGEIVATTPASQDQSVQATASKVGILTTSGLRSFRAVIESNFEETENGVNVDYGAVVFYNKKPVDNCYTVVEFSGVGRVTNYNVEPEICRDAARILFEGNSAFTVPDSPGKATPVIPQNGVQIA